MQSGGLNSRLAVAAVDGMAIVVDANTGPLWDNQSVVAKSATVTLTSTQIKALLATPIEILAAPPSGYVNIIVDASCKTIYGGSNVFTNPQATRLYWGSKSGSQASNAFSTSTMLNQTSNRYSSVPTRSAAVFPSSNVEATNLVICNDGGSEITGNAGNDNSLKVSIHYVTVKI